MMILVSSKSASPSVNSSLSDFSGQVVQHECYVSHDDYMAATAEQQLNPAALQQYVLW
jgi:hypothetical protein